jgi:hypothetical protein
VHFHKKDIYSTVDDLQVEITREPLNLAAYEEISYIFQDLCDKKSSLDAIRLAMGGAAFLLLMAAELALPVFVFARLVSGHWQHYLTLAGALGLTGQIAFAAFPYLMQNGTPHAKPES